jgi:hypothetical protein
MISPGLSKEMHGGEGFSIVCSKISNAIITS